MINKKIIVWDLFGGSQNSIYNSLKYFKDYEIFTFDIVNNQVHTNNINLDLSQDWEKLKTELNKFPKPNIITASPMCQSFSIILHYENGTLGWKKINEKWETRTAEEINLIKLSSGFYKKFDGKNLKNSAELGGAIIKKYFKNNI